MLMTDSKGKQACALYQQASITLFGQSLARLLMTWDEIDPRK